MHMAVAFDYNVWIAGNTALCHRLSARITETACEKNRQISTGENGDLRCEGCGGLHNQLERRTTQLQLVTSAASPGEAAAIDPFTVALMSTLDEKEECTEAEPGTVEEESDDSDAWAEEDDLDDEVLRLFPELREFIEEREPTPIATGTDWKGESEDRREKTASKTRHSQNKYAVYIGRCERCDGYMTNDIERHDSIKDDDVYRCFTCGWRTSPAYQWNRYHLMPVI